MSELRCGTWMVDLGRRAVGTGSLKEGAIMSADTTFVESVEGGG
jgi:hypothetical protein